MTVEPIFPIIQTFDKDIIIYGCTGRKEYIRCDLRFIPRYKDSKVIDSTGKLFLISDAYQVKWGTWFWGYHPLIKGRQVELSINYGEIRQLDWTQFENFIDEKLSKKTSSLCYPNSKASIRKKLNNSSSFKDVIEMFSFELT